MWIELVKPGVDTLVGWLTEVTVVMRKEAWSGLEKLDQVEMSLLFLNSGQMGD